MHCQKEGCKSKYTVVQHIEIVALADGSPSRGKNVKWVKTKAKKVTCLDCGSGYIV